MAASTHKALKAALESGGFDPVYLFHGADDFLKEERVKALIGAATDPATRDFNLDQLRGAECDAQALAAALDALPMLAARRVVVLRDPAALKKPAKERLERHLKSPPADLLLLLVLPAGAKGDAALSDGATVVEFKPLGEDALLKWIDHRVSTSCGTTIDPNAAALLASYGGSDLALLAGELQKLASFTAGAAIGVDAVNAVTGVRPGHTMVDLLDRVAARDTMGGVGLVEEVLAQPKANGVQLVLALTTQMLAIGWGIAARARGVSAARLPGEYFALLKEAGNAFTGRAWGDATQAWAKAVPRWSAGEVDAAIPHLLAADAALKDTKVSSEGQIITSLLLAMTPVATKRRAA